MQNQRRISICGGGLGGLALAVTIGKFNPDVPIDVFEAGSAITTTGAGVTMWKRTWQVMQRLGMDTDLAKRTVVPPADEPALGMTFRKANMPNGGYTFFEQVVPYGKIGLHRADLLDVLVNHLPKSCTVHLNKRLTHYTTSTNDHTGISANEARPVTLHFSDGTTAAADVLIGADGIRSPTRKTLFQHLAKERNDECLLAFGEPVWSGAIAYRYLIPREDLDKVWPNHRVLERGLTYCGKNKHLVAYTVSQGKYINVAAFDTKRELEGTPFPHGKWVADVPTQEAVDAYSGFEPEAMALLQLMKVPSRWAVHVLKPTTHWVNGNVAILGDASHAMRPCFGTGAGSAIEDAYILGRLLALPSSRSHPIPKLLKTYERVRVPLANELLVGARLTGFLYDFTHEGYADGSEGSASYVARHESANGGHGKTEEEVMKRHGEAIRDKWNKVHFTTTPDDDWREAEGLLAAGFATAKM
ncbi:hypothetical protein BDV98DRAFT_564139 [Pterulicium gracile]|uniref:FAD-binding domain-containing protein n=1 Tax=Pterulicium gracile TaxID=1884261 RepID=A0A5C3QP77_9AGAR|nr:hypothetical protein BDV98DRAFT_564139 [Pterula gracilis]